MHNFILTNVVFFTTVAVELIFNFYKETPSHLSVEKFIGLFVILFIFSFIKNNFWRRLSMNFVVGLSFFQMMHIQFYGMPVYPMAIYLLFADTKEAFDVLIQELGIFTIPTLLVFPAIILNVFTDKKAFLLKKVPYLHFLFIFYFIYNPARTLVTGNTWGRQPSTQEFMGMNIYLSTSYFLGKILPHKIFKNQLAKELDVKPSSLFILKEKPQDLDIVIVLGESLSANHLSLLGYSKKTTPYLDSLIDDPNFFFRRGISSGVSTDVAVAMLMNNTYGPNGSEDVFLGHQCLFELAKRNNFKTKFYSTQSSQQLRYITNSICPSAIEDYKDLDTLHPTIDNANKADDRLSIRALTQLDKSKNYFIMLHQRGSHSPYELRYPKENITFPLTGNYDQDRVIHYDNSVVEFDNFMKEAISKVKEISDKALIVYVSDHGEGLGEEGVWGHAALKRPSVEIPVLFYTHNVPELHEKLNSLPENPTHFNISLFITKLLGWKIDTAGVEDIFDIPKNYTILANDIDGFAGYLETEFKDGKLISIQRKDI